MELGDLSNLNHLMLYGNQLTGNIPTSLTNLTDLTSTDIGYNALHTDDNTLRIFLDTKDPDWENTQTFAPENVTANVTSDTSIEMSWTPITYTSDSGGYRVFYSTTPGGPYTLFSATADKSASQMEVTGLNPNATYYFVVQTRTEPHSANQNTVDSEYSVEVSAKTTGNDADTDDDGLADGTEDANHNGIVDSGETDPCNVDTDGDGIQDGTEAGLTLLDIGTDTDGNIFISDTDPNTTTDPLSLDTDQDGMSDGEEDANHNGMVDEGETDPAGADRYVSNSGSNLTGDGTSGNPWQTIQFAIDQVSAGGTIHVADGTYTGAENKNIDFLGKAVALISENGPELTIIDCEGNGRGFYFFRGEDETTIVSGFTITNGHWGGPGGGIYIGHSSPTIDNCHINSNTSLNCGGAINIYGTSSPQIKNCTINGNSAPTGGGIHVSWSSGSTTVLENCIIEENPATVDDGGGIYLQLYHSNPAIISNCIIQNNSSVSKGGGCYIASNCLIIQCVINNNMSGDGGGIYCLSSAASIHDSLFQTNSANYGGAFFNENASPNISNCQFVSNDSGVQGGAIYNYNASSPTISNCIFASNRASWGGGISNQEYSSPIVENSTFWGNAAGTDGGGIYCINSSEPVIKNCILWNDSCGWPYGCSSEIGNYDGITLSTSYSNLQGGYLGIGNIDSDPLFANPENRNFQLLIGSPCIDSGDPNSPPDPDGSRADMGALYFSEKLNLSINTHWYNWATTFPEYQNKIKRYNFVRDGAWWSSLEAADYTTQDDWNNAAWSYPYEITITNCNQSTTYQSGYDELVKKFQSSDAPGLLLLLDIHNDNLNADANAITYDQFYDYVYHIVERYDGDGYDDMPGLTRSVIYFEIGNEVDSANPAHSHNLSLENYVNNRLIPAYRAAKDANPNAVILNAGLAMGGRHGF